jgi:hypothetical protein
MKIYVIAGTYAEAMSWIKKEYLKRWNNGDRSCSISDYIIPDRNSLRGINNPHGVFVGNWKARADIYEIVQTLIWSSTHVNPALNKIYNDLTPKIRPTPLKLKPVAGGWILDLVYSISRETKNEQHNQTSAKW